VAWTELSSRDAVLKALKEFDALGREPFLSKYGFGRSARYVLEHDGRQYDAKAVIGAAHGVQFPDEGPLRSEDFPSSERAVKGTLTALGFKVTSKVSK
jgi:hypothetical protein